MCITVFCLIILLMPSNDSVESGLEKGIVRLSCDHMVNDIIVCRVSQKLS